MTRRSDFPTELNGAALTKYLRHKDKIANTLFVVKPDGSKFYVDNDREIPEKEFLSAYPVAVTSFLQNVKKNADGTKRWIQPD